MSYSLVVLLWSAFTIGSLHTIMGPDHYIPFIAMSKARNWSILKTTVITTVCGMGHVFSAFILGIMVVFLGTAVTKLKFIEAVRLDIAAWLLIVSGFIYFIWGVRSAMKTKKALKWRDENNNVLAQSDSKKDLMPWVLFIIFVLGPCEPLIPLIIYPATQGLILDVFLILTVFGLATVATMLIAVIASVYGMTFFRMKFLDVYGNAAAGAIIFGSGMAVKFLGL